MSIEPQDEIDAGLTVAKDGPKGDEDLKKYYEEVLDWDDSDQVLEQIIRRHRDYEGACKLAWGLYCVAMGVDLKSFRGIPGDGPEDAVRKRITAYQRLLHDAYSLIFQSEDPESGPWIKRYIEMMQGRVELSPPNRHMNSDHALAAGLRKSVPGACGPECGEMHTYSANCRMSSRTDS